MSACDACRRRRIRCNRLQPCDRCIKSAITCTYGQGESRTSISYTRRLEQKIARLETLVDDAQRSQSASVAESVEDSAAERDGQSIDLLVGPSDDFVFRASTASTHCYYRYHAALNVLRVIGDACGDEETKPGSAMLAAFGMLSALPPSPSGATVMLPLQQKLLDMTAYVTRRVLVCHDCIDGRDFTLSLQKLYDKDPEDYDTEDEIFLALVYVTIALGKRYQGIVTDDADTAPKGLSYLRASRAILEKHHSTRNLNSIRAMILQVRYLLSNSKLPAAYRMLHRAIAAAVQMGLHLATPIIQNLFTEEERFQRRRVFAVLYMMDTYLASTMGVPKVLTHVDHTQLLGLRDADLADEGTSFIAQNPTSPLTESVLCQKLYRAHVEMMDIYSTLENDDLTSAPSERVSEIHTQLEEWHHTLPEITPDDQDSDSLFGQLTLRLHHAAAQIMLYRYFLHHLSRRRDDPRFSVRGYEYGSLCVRAANQIIWLVEAFQAHAVDNEAFWFHTYALAFAGSILTYFVLSAQQRATVEESVAAAGRARDLLQGLARRNAAARQIHGALAPLIEACQMEA